MSGHSKWSTIKRKKEAIDAKKGQIFTKLSKMISLAAREGGVDIDVNFKLKLAIDKAKEANMPSDNIKRAIERGAGIGKDVHQIEEVVYEVIGPEGVAVLVTCLTDNKNRSLSDLKGIFSKLGGALGSVSWMFDKRGQVVVNKVGRDASSQYDWEEIKLEAIDNGAIDFSEDGNNVEFYSEVADLEKLKNWLDAKNLDIESAGLANVPKDLMVISDGEKREKLINFLTTLEDLDDVDRVETNVDFVD